MADEHRIRHLGHKAVKTALHAAGIAGIHDTGYALTKNVVHVGAEKTIVSTLQPALQPVLQPATAGAAGGIAAGMSGAAMILGVGMTAGLSALLSQMEYEHQLGNLKHFYQEELDAKIGHHKTKDIVTLARGKGVEPNRTLRQQLSKLRLMRAVSIGLTFLGTLAAVAAVGLSAPLFTHVAETAATPFLVSAGQFAVKALIGISVYTAIKRPLHVLGYKLFGLDKKTTHERIEELQRDRDEGKTVTREQVFAVFASAHPEIENGIRSQFGGRSYDELEVADKTALAEQVGKLINVDKLASDINHGRIRAAELAFAAEGQVSGVLPKEYQHVQKPGMMHAIASRVGHVVHRLRARLPHHRAAPVPIAHSQAPYAPQTASRSFVDLVGKKQDAPLGYVERLEQSRANLPPNVTLH